MLQNVRTPSCQQSACLTDDDTESLGCSCGCSLAIVGVSRLSCAIAITTYVSRPQSACIAADKALHCCRVPHRLADLAGVLTFHL